MRAAHQVVYENGRWDGKTPAEWVPEVVDAIVRAFDPIEVVLFGSIARGDLTPRSDADLLVILRAADDPPRHRVPRYLPADSSVPLDVFPFTRAELDERVSEGNPFFVRALREAVRIYP